MLITHARVNKRIPSLVPRLIGICWVDEMTFTIYLIHELLMFEFAGILPSNGMTFLSSRRISNPWPLTDLPCCHESPSPECRSTCEAVLRRTGEAKEIADGLATACGAPALHDGLYQCFLRKDQPPDSKDVIPHDAAKLHCCHKVRIVVSLVLPSYYVMSLGEISFLRLTLCLVHRLSLSMVWIRLCLIKVRWNSKFSILL